MARRTKEEIINDIKKKGETLNIDIIGEYLGTSTPIKVFCNNCKKEFSTYPLNFLKGTGCVRCYGSNNIQKTKEEFIEDVKRVHGEDYIPLEDYVNGSTKIRILHKVCNKEFKVSPNNFLYANKKRGATRCPHCYGSKPIGIDNFKNKVKELVGDEYIVLSETYTNNREKLELYHKKCNQVYSVCADKFLNGRRCRCSLNYRNEEDIKKYLKDKNITFTEQATFKNLKGAYHDLTVDFFIPDLNLIIEYDGELHFKDRFRKKDEPHTLKFLSQLKNDKIKDKYFKNKKYNLLRISYKNAKNKLSLIESAISDIKNGNKVYVPKDYSLIEVE